VSRTFLESVLYRQFRRPHLKKMIEKHANKALKHMAKSQEYLETLEEEDQIKRSERMLRRVRKACDG